MTTAYTAMETEDEGMMSSWVATVQEAAKEPEIAFFDVETSIPQGPEPQRCVLLEFGAIVLCPRRLVEVALRVSMLVRPTDLGVVTAALERKGITRDAVERAPSFRDVAGAIHDVLHERIWAGHNIYDFDSKIIREAFAEIGWPPPEPKEMIDTLPLLRQRFGRRAGNMKMKKLADFFGLGPQIHRSLDDVRMNIDVLKCCATVLFLEGNFPEVLSGFSGFLEPDDVSNEFIQVSLSFSYPFKRSLSIKHNDIPLQLCCTDLRVRFEVRPEYQQDIAGRWKLKIVVDIPDYLIKVLEFCDELARRSSREFGSTSVWRPVIKEYGNSSAVRLNIPTTGSGGNETYATDMYDASGSKIQKLVFSRVDVAVLGALFAPGDMVDAFFFVELYDYMQNAGIRLVAKKLVVHQLYTRSRCSDSRIYLI